jgi:hypothetical protein
VVASTAVQSAFADADPTELELKNSAPKVQEGKFKFCDSMELTPVTERAVALNELEKEMGDAIMRPAYDSQPAWWLRRTMINEATNAQNAMA